MKKNYKMVLQYDGGRYNGWQKQKNTENTIQAKIESMLTRFFNQEIEIQGSGRTDAGVHAKGQVASFKVDYKSAPKEALGITDDELLRDLNAYLPDDIKIVSMEETDMRFHARLNAVKKEYRYFICLDDKKDVFLRKYCISKEKDKFLDVTKMQEASRKLLGEHDFAPFSDNKSNKSTVRNIEKISFDVEDDLLIVSFVGDGFLYHMVRIIVWVLLEIGYGRKESAFIDEIFNSRNRRLIQNIAPSEGLFLYNVWY